MKPFHPSLRDVSHHSRKTSADPPCRHKCQHDQRTRKIVIILIHRFCTWTHLRETEYLHENDGHEYEDRCPKDEEVSNRWKTRHRRLEQLVERVETLHQLECDGHEEELLYLFACLVTVLAAQTSLKCWDRGDKTAGDDDHIEQVPSVGSETVKPKSYESHNQVNCVENRQDKEDPICKLEDP